MAITNKLTAIANAIRTKTGTTGSMTLAQMPEKILSIETGGSSGGSTGLIGANPILVDEQTYTWGLSDTSYASSSTYTTATSLKTATAYTTPTYAYGDKDIVVIQFLKVKPTFTGSTGKAEEFLFYGSYVSMISKRQTSKTSNMTTRQVASCSSYLMLYVNSSGSSAAQTSGYGIYGTMSAASMSSNSAATTSVKVSSPVIYARSSSTYCSSANIQKITDCDIEWSYKIYAVDQGSTPFGKIFRDIYDFTHS